MEFTNGSTENFYSLLTFSLFALHASAVDIKKFQIPNSSIFAGTASLLVLHIFIVHEGIAASLAGFFAGGTIFFIIRLTTGKGLGMGDVKFAAFMGTFNGFPGWFTAAAIASLMGLSYSMCGIAAGKLDRKSPIPFAPFLTLGSIGAWFINPNQITDIITRGMT